MNYIEPQLDIYQVFEPVLDTGVRPLNACVIGPKYGLHRYGTEEEELVGSYDPSASAEYPWPGRAPSSEVLQDSAEVIIQDAVVEYYNGADFTVPSGSANEIVSGSLVLQSKNGYSRSAVFGNRDVRIGDGIVIKQGSEEINTVIIDLKGEPGGTVGAPNADDSNQVAVSAVAPNVVSEDVADANLTIGAGGTYSGIADGYVEETYTIQVTAAGAPGVAKASVVSASGSDDVAEITLDDGVAVGSRGITLTVTDAGSGAFAAGETIVVSAREEYALPTLTESGDYTGNMGTTYAIQITEGGTVGTDTPKFRVVTNNGYDIQGITDITTNAAPVGNYGVSITFSGQLVKGDVWYIEAVPASEKAVKTVVTAASLATLSQGAVDSVSLRFADTVLLSDDYVTTSEDYIDIAANAEVEDTYAGTGGKFPVLGGDVYIEYVELLTEGVDFGILTSVDEVEAVLGPVVPDNKLAYGMNRALLNSNGVGVYYCSTPSDDASGFNEALDRISIEDNVWSLVPLTFDTAVLANMEAFINEQSNEINNNWKKGWFCRQVDRVTPFYTEENGSQLEGTIAADGHGDYKIVTVPGAKFKTTGSAVRSGDILKYNPHTVDMVIVYDEAVIESATDDETLVLRDEAINIVTPSVMEVWRESGLYEYAADIAAASSSYGNRRINNIWPESIPDETGEEVAGYFLCAALAAYRSAAAPHQPLTRAEISGFGTPSKTLQFSRSQLNIIAAGGTWIVTSDLSGKVFTRHQLTTDMTDVNTREDSITSNLDSISRVFREGFDPLIGKGNVTPDMLELIEGRVFTSFKMIHNLPYPRNLGPQLLGYELVELSIDPVLKSKIRVRIKPDLPVPLNNMDLFFLVGGATGQTAV